MEERNMNENLTLSDYEDFFEELALDNSKENTVELYENPCLCGSPSTEELSECENDGCSRLFHRSCTALGHTLGITLGSTTSTLTGFCHSCSSGVSGIENSHDISTYGNADDTIVPLPRVQQCSAGGGEVQDDTAKLRASTSSDDRGSTNEGTKSTKQKSRPKKDKMSYPTKRFSFKDCNDGALFKEAMGCVKDERSLQVDTPLSHRVKELGDHLSNYSNSEQFRNFATNIEHEVWMTIQPMQGVPWDESHCVQMWQRFHAVRSNEKHLTEWQHLLNHFGIERQAQCDALLLQVTIKVLHRKLIAKVIEEDGESLQTERQPYKLDMEMHEEQALRYCAGYVPFKLIKKYRKMEHSEMANGFVNVLSQWCDQSVSADDEGFLSYTKGWIRANDRGGLFNITDETYRFFQSLEIVVRKNLSVDNFPVNNRVNLKEMLMRELKADQFVCTMWGKVCKDLPANMTDKLLEEVLKCFIKMRITAFLRVVVMLQKSVNRSVSKTGEKSLRKMLVT